jgi:type I restriction enzyme R subunit
MRDHGLLQAIARVNRVFEDKPGGLVVDYIGIGDDLRAGLTAYAKGDVDDVVVPLEVAQARLREKHQVMCDLLHGIDFRPPESATAGQQATVLAAAAQEAVARYVLDDERTEVLLDEHAQYAKWFSLVSPNEPTVAQRYDGPSREARRAVEQFFSAGLAGSEILDVFAMAGDARPEISVLSDDFLDDVASRLTRPELQVALMKKLLNGEIRTRLAGNRVQHKRFSDEVAAVLARYEAKQITSAEVVKELVNLARDLRSQARRHEQLGLSREETAFYDALAARGEAFVDDPRLKEIAVELVTQVRQDLAVDWTERGNLEARIRARIKRLLRRHRYTAPEGGGGLDEVADRVFRQARALYERWPEVEGGSGSMLDR